MWPFRKMRIDSNLNLLPFSELRKRTRILVIDDDENSFPIETLKPEGYAIDYWSDVKELSKLEEGAFDIIFLDIQGVGSHYTNEEGLGILECIKYKNPGQIVVAFSGHSFDLSKNKFWKLADDSLCKPVQAARCKQVIDDLIKTKLTPSHYWSSIAQLLKSQGYTDRQIAKLENKLHNALAGKDRNEIEGVIRKNVDRADLATKAIATIGKIIALLS